MVMLPTTMMGRFKLKEKLCFICACIIYTYCVIQKNININTTIFSLSIPYYSALHYFFQFFPIKAGFFLHFFPLIYFYIKFFSHGEVPWWFILPSDWTVCMCRIIPAVGLIPTGNIPNGNFVCRALTNYKIVTML